METMNLQPMTYKVYARPDELGRVVSIFSTCFEQPTENDVFIKEGSGDEFVHVQGSYPLFDDNFCHNYKIEDGVMVETTEQDKQDELDARQKPEPTLTLEEKIENLEVNNAEMLYQICLLQLGMDADIEIPEEGGGEDGL